MPDAIGKKQKDHFVGEIPDVESYELIHRGKWANADVYRVWQGQVPLIYKGFGSRSFWVRWTIGRFLTWREVSMLQKLSGIPGIPRITQRSNPYSLCYHYMEGETLSSKVKGGTRLPKRYFLEAEALLDEIHRRGVVHLDLRRGANWMVSPDGGAGIIDFQSAFSIEKLPKFLRKKLCDIDYSGAYKLWERYCEEDLDPQRKTLLDRVNQHRKLWVFRGYILQNRKKKASRRSCDS